MPRSYRMTPARRAALRKAQQASARKRKGKGKRTTPKARTYKQIRRRQRIKTGAKLAAVGGAYAAAHAAGAYVSHQNRGANRKRVNHHVKRHTGTSPNVVFGPRARAHGGGPNRSNRVFVTSKHGTTSVRRKHH